MLYSLFPDSNRKICGSFCFEKWITFILYSFRRFWLFCSVLHCFGKSLSTWQVSWIYQRSPLEYWSLGLQASYLKSVFLENKSRDQHLFPKIQTSYLLTLLFMIYQHLIWITLNRANRICCCSHDRQGGHAWPWSTCNPAHAWYWACSWGLEWGENGIDRRCLSSSKRFVSQANIPVNMVEPKLSPQVSLICFNRCHCYFGHCWSL